MIDLGIDFGNIFNIVFVAAAAAVILFLLISTIAVAVKGKRKCNAFDVILRILSTLALIVSVVMLAGFVLSMLDGDFRLQVTAPDAQAGSAAAAAFIMGDSVIDLPLADLFVLLASVIGLFIGAVLLMLSLTALIVDCLVANKKTDKQKKSDKQKKTKQTKTPEQLKREAELERIRRIGETAVRKTSSVASSSGKSEVTEHAESETASPATDTDEPDFDWRVQPKEQKQHEFVGLKETNDEFDSFDSFDSDGAENASPVTEDTEIEQQEQPLPDMQEPELEQAQEPKQDFVDSDDNYDVDDIALEQNVAEEEPLSELQLEQDDEQPTDEYSVDGQEDEGKYDDMSAWQFDAQPASDETFDIGQTDESVIDEALNDFGDEQEQPAPQFVAPQEENYDNIEPNRDIYIPKVRTITRLERTAKPAAKPAKSAAKATAKPATRSTAKAAAKPAAKPATKPAAKTTAKPATKSAAKSTVKPIKPVNNNIPAARAKTAAAAPKKQTKSDIPAEKKLPVTRRYVILDRHNAVNMFGEYLKERNKADKDALTSSINTIIIE